MSSATAKLGSTDADILIGNCSSTAKKCSNGSRCLLVTDTEDAQESDGADSGYTWKKNENNESKFENFSPKSSDEEDEEDFGAALRQIFSDPNPVKLISAMKGGREKNGLSPVKLCVKWAEDVYDPPPSIESHTRVKKHHQKSKSKDKENQKKNSKRNQKLSNSSRDRSGKDSHSSSKKHQRKNSSNCGGSFVNANQTKVHFSVTEAR